MSKALTLDDQIVKAGRLIRVLNKAKPGVIDDDESVDHTSNVNFVVWVEDANGKNERPLMMTPEMLAAAEFMANENEEDIPKKSLLQDLLD